MCLHYNCTKQVGQITGSDTLLRDWKLLPFIFTMRNISSLVLPLLFYLCLFSSITTRVPVRQSSPSIENITRNIQQGENASNIMNPPSHTPSATENLQPRARPPTVCLLFNRSTMQARFGDLSTIVFTPFGSILEKSTISCCYRSKFLSCILYTLIYKLSWHYNYS